MEWSGLASKDGEVEPEVNGSNPATSFSSILFCFNVYVSHTYIFLFEYLITRVAWLSGLA